MNENVDDNLSADHSYSAAVNDDEVGCIIKCELEPEINIKVEADAMSVAEQLAQDECPQSSVQNKAPSSSTSEREAEEKGPNENVTSESTPPEETSRRKSVRKAKIAAVTKLSIQKSPKSTPVPKEKKVAKRQRVRTSTGSKRLSTNSVPHHDKVLKNKKYFQVSDVAMGIGLGIGKSKPAEFVTVQLDAPSSSSSSSSSSPPALPPLKAPKPRGSILDNVVPSVGAEHPLQRSTLLQLIDCDAKLCNFTGIPSFEILDKLCDATLKMVLSSQQLIRYVEPILRVWIIVTCSKLALNLSLEVVSIMFDIELNDCTRIFERTCHFLRKALVLPECQAYIPMIPMPVLSGIADCTDGHQSDSLPEPSN